MAPGEKVKAVFTGADTDDRGTLIVTFENGSGTLTHKVWNNYDVEINDITHPDPDKKKMAENDKDLCERVAYHIGGALIPRETLDTIGGINFKAYVAELVKHFNATAKGTEVVLHVVVNSRNYVDLPKYPNFIKSEHLPESDWESDPRYHKYEKTKAADNADREVPVSKVEDKPDLPF